MTNLNNKTGIYTITNKINKKMYIGYANNLLKRKSYHWYKLRNNQHPNEYLQNSWNKYGEENFEFEILEECNKNFLASQEHYWANLLNVFDRKNGFNIKPTHPYGKVLFSELHRKNIGKSNRKKVLQKDKNGNIIKIWNDIYEIIESNLNYKYEGILNNIGKRIKTYKGFVWERQNKELKTNRN